MRTVYLILGMHRSGTSALGGVLNTMGLDIGSYLMPANETNPKGYFENRFVYWHNEKILNENHSSWSDFHFDISVISPEKIQLYRNEAMEILEKEFAHSLNFFIKDPRICLLFPIWESACKQLDIDIKVIIPYRNPMEVAESLKNRNKFTTEKGLILWSKHFYLAEYYSRNYKRIFLSYDSLIDDTRKYVNALEKFTKFDVSSSSISKINHFIEKDYKHINIPISDFDKNTPYFLTKTVELIKNKNFEDAEQMDIIRHDFNQILKFFENNNLKASTENKRLTEEKVRLIKEKESLTHEKESLTHEKESLTHEKKGLTHEKESLIREKEILNKEIEKLKRSNNEFLEANTSIQDKIEEEQRINKVLLQSNASKQNKIEALDQHNIKLNKKVTIIKNNAKSHISEGLNKISNLEKTHTNKNEYIIDLQKSLNLNQADLSELKQNKIQTQQNLIKVKGKISHAMASFTMTCKTNHNEQIQFKDNAANNIKQFHLLYTLHIGSKVAERIELDNRIKKIKSNPLSYLNPLRLRNLFIQLNDLNYHIESIEKKFNDIPWKIIESFNDAEYLENNDDVNQAILSGQFINALQHFILFGYDEVQSGARNFNSHSDSYIHSKLNRSNKEKEAFFNDYLTKQSDSFELLKNNEFDNLLNLDFIDINHTPNPETKKPKSLVHDPVSEVDTEKKDTFITTKIHRWLQIRGIEFTIVENGLDLKNSELFFKSELKDEQFDDIVKQIFQLSKQIKIEKYKNHAVENNISIIFSESKTRLELSHLISTNNLVIVCYGIIYNKELIQSIQPTLVVSVFNEKQKPIESIEIIVPDELKKDYKYTRIIEQSEKHVCEKINNNIIDISKIKITKSKNTFKFNIEYISASGISGWIFRVAERSPDSFVELLLTIDDKDSISINNINPREDVKRAYNLKCSSGFHFNLPICYLNGDAHDIVIYAKHENKYHLLKKIEFVAKSPWKTISPKTHNTVLFCSHNLRSQGAQNSLFELAIGLKRLYGIMPIVQSPVDGPLSKKYEEHGIQVIIDNSLNIILDDIHEWNNQIEICANKLKYLNCSVLVANTLQTFSMIHAANQANIPTLWIPRESEPPITYFDYLSKPLKNKAELTFSIASQVVFVANATRRIWSFMDTQLSFKVIHNSLNTSLLNQDSVNSRYEIRKAFGIKSDEVVLLSLGTVSTRKGQLDFINSLPHVLANTNKTTKAFIVGMGSNPNSQTDEYSNNVRKTVENFPVEIRKHITLIPETDKLINTKTYDFYAMADIFVFTSRIESFPRVMLEAMYFGLPVITTPCFGVVEQCIENYNAYYYDENDVNQLEINLIALINNDQKRMSFSQGSKQLFENMQTYDQMLNNYHNLIKNHYTKERP